MANPEACGAQRNVGHRIGLWLLQIALPDRRGHADDGQRRRSAAPGGSAPSGVSLMRPSQRILRAEVHGRESLVDDCGVLARRPIEIVELRPRKFRKPRVSKYRGPIMTCVTVGACSPAGERTALDRQQRPLAPAQRHVRCDRAGLNPPIPAIRWSSRSKKARRDRSSGTSVPAAPGASSGGARVHADIQPVERQEAPHHQARAGEQHQRQRQLGDDQHARSSGGP